jgi:hypothetical protein
MTLPDILIFIVGLWLVIDLLCAWWLHRIAHRRRDRR